MQRTQLPKKTVEAYGGRKYRPHAKSREVLDTAMRHIKSVNYRVSVRWVFYRLLQDGIYSSKDDYNKLIHCTREARKNFWREWRPWTLADESRGMARGLINLGEDHPDQDVGHLIERGIMEGKGDIAYHKDQAENYEFSLDLCIDPRHYQDYVFVIMYEAKAMTEQFLEFTPNDIPLVPSGGYTSVEYKWRIAERLREWCGHYEKPGLVLYFGDHDKDGHQIFEAARDDILQWCGEPVEFVRCGITLEQARHYQVPENLDKPGCFQWEALTDDQAEEILQSSLENYYNFDAKRQAEAQEIEIKSEVDPRVNELLQQHYDQ